MRHICYMSMLWYRCNIQSRSRLPVGDVASNFATFNLGGAFFKSVGLAGLVLLRRIWLTEEVAQSKKVLLRGRSFCQRRSFPDRDVFRQCERRHWQTLERVFSPEYSFRCARLGSNSWASHLGTIF